MNEEILIHLVSISHLNINNLDKTARSRVGTPEQATNTRGTTSLAGQLNSHIKTFRVSIGSRDEKTADLTD